MVPTEGGAWVAFRDRGHQNLGWLFTAAVPSPGNCKGVKLALLSGVKGTWVTLACLYQSLRRISILPIWIIPKLWQLLFSNFNLIDGSHKGKSDSQTPVSLFFFFVFRELGALIKLWALFPVSQGGSWFGIISSPHTCGHLKDRRTPCVRTLQEASVHQSSASTMDLD